MRKEYVVGFMFDDSGERVVLIRKNRPEWQAGKANGVGGKVEENELHTAAMVREFFEETGVQTNLSDWDLFATMAGRDFHEFEISFFRSFNTEFYAAAETKTDEKIEKWYPDTECFENGNPVPNLKWLIPMALTKNLHYAELTYQEAA